MSNRRLKRRKQQLEDKQNKHFTPTLIEDDGTLVGTYPDQAEIIEATKLVNAEIAQLADEMDKHLTQTTFNVLKLTDFDPKFNNKYPNFRLVLNKLVDHHSNYFLQRKKILDKGEDKRYDSYQMFLEHCLYKNHSMYMENEFHFLLTEITFESLFKMTEVLMQPMYKAFPSTYKNYIRLHRYNIFRPETQYMSETLKCFDCVDLKEWNLEIKPI